MVEVVVLVEKGSHTPCAPIHSRQLRGVQREKEREERREEKREPRTSRAGSPSTHVRPSGQRDPVPLRQGEVGWTDSAKQWYKVLKAKKAGLDAARKTEQAAATQGRPDGGVKRHPSLVLPLS